MDVSSHIHAPIHKYINMDVQHTKAQVWGSFRYNHRNSHHHCTLLSTADPIHWFSYLTFSGSACRAYKTENIGRLLARACVRVYVCVRLTEHLW